MWLTGPTKRWMGALVALTLAGPGALSSQQGQITGRVVDASTLQPLSAVQVYVEGSGFGGLSGANGAFSIQNVPAGTHTLVAQRIGYQQLRRSVQVTTGEATAVELALQATVLMLQEVVATGLIDPVEGVRSPITVARVNREIMPVTVAGPAVQNLQGMMAGVTINRRSGQPGDEVNMQLRTPTSMSGATTPLIVVDGVILGSGTSNIAAEDIETIEVIKGAAAASLYGSRAAAGVIAITTNRGRSLDVGRTRFAVRTEMGTSQAHSPDFLPVHHQYLVDHPANPTTYVDFDGNPVPRNRRVAPLPALAFMDKPYPGPTYNNVVNAFGGGGFAMRNFSMMHNAESTNFALLLNNYREAGALLNNEGYDRNSVRVNLDHRFMENVTLGLSAFHSRDWRDEIEGFTTFTALYRAPRDIDLTKKDESGQYVRIPDPQVAYENPLWIVGSREGERKRARTLGSANLRWEPHHWVVFGGNVSFDREDGTRRAYLPKGTPASITSDDLHDGGITIDRNLRDTWNGEAQVSLRQNFGALNVRTTFRGLLERDSFDRTRARGRDFFVVGVPRIDATANRYSESEETEIRSEGYLWDTAFDYEGKYILTVLGRRDGSSLFGPDNRWHNYYRVAGAWRLAEEPWFNLPNVDEFKVSYARGTAGGRPPFEGQYETWRVTEIGVSKATLGNRNLRPEHTSEQEVSLDMILFGRVGMDLTYAWQRTTDQLLNNPVPQFTGYATQWTNGGSIVGNTWELTLETRVRPGWTTQFVVDRSRSRIDDWPFSCQAPGYRYWCAGVGMYHIYGQRQVETWELLRTTMGGKLAPYADEFMINDDGWMVWVGKGNHYTDGFSKGLWGTSTTLAGRNFNWGMPFFDQDEQGVNVRQHIGYADRNNFGWTNNLRFGAVALHAHVIAAVGAEIAGVYRALYVTEDHPFMDQVGTKKPKPDELKKPIAYYQALEGGSGNNSGSSRADFIRLGTFSATYQLGPRQLERFGFARLGLGRLESATVGLVGRDLLMLTNCVCADPQQGSRLDGDRNPAFGSGTNLGDLEQAYPTSRTFTVEFGLTF